MREEIKISIYRHNNWVNVEFSKKNGILVCSKTFGYGLFRIIFNSKLRNKHWEDARFWATKQAIQINNYSNIYCANL